MADSQTDAEFSRFVPLGELSKPLAEWDIEANAEERKALALRLGLIELGSLRARLTLRRKPGSSLILLTGRFKADVVQTCVVTLRPVPARVEDIVRLSYSLAEANRLSGEGAALLVDPEGDDPPETIGPRGIDVGEAAVQQLAVALEPYPRADGAVLAQQTWGAGEDGEDAVPSPFEGLRELKSKREEH